MTLAPPSGLSESLAAITRGARARDRDAGGLDEPLEILERAGVLAWNAEPGEPRPAAGPELALVREVARADASVGRVLDGHLNGVERLAVQAPSALAERELSAVRQGRLRVGVWGGDPREADGEGEPAWLEPRRGPAGTVGEHLHGVKTFCSGAGSLDRALVLCRTSRSGGGPAAAVWVDLRDVDHVEVDEGWYLSSGLRASASHRVSFDRAPVLARFGDPGAISLQPWFSRDVLRTAASWAGMVDGAVDAALAELASRPDRGELEALAAGRMLAASAVIDALLENAARAMDDPGPGLWRLAVGARAGIVAAARRILGVAASACGSHPFATGGDLDRARRDLELFLLQHRLEPGLVRMGTTVLDELATGATR